MHDLNWFRTHLDEVAGRLSTRGYKLDVEKLRALDTERRAALTETEQLKAQRNKESVEIGKLRKQGQDTTERQAKMREMGDRSSALDEQAKALDEQFGDLLAGVPNVPHESVPVGRDAEDNVEVRRVGAAAAIRLRGRRPTGTSVPNWASSIWSAPPRSPVPASPSTSAPARGSSGR